MTRTLTDALLLVGASGGRLARRPAGVAHVYVGPLTPSGRFVPRSARTVCRARTRRLAVTSLLTCLASGARLCARCSACLDASPVAARQAESPVSREDHLVLHAGTTARDLEAAADAAATVEQLDYVAHVSLLVLTHPGCTKARTRTGRTLHDHLAAHRRRLSAVTAEQRDARWVELRAFADQRRKADTHEIWQAREDRITRLGINNATRRSPR